MELSLQVGGSSDGQVRGLKAPKFDLAIGPKRVYWYPGWYPELD